MADLKLADLAEVEWIAPPRRARKGATTDSIALVACRNGTGVILAEDGEGIEADSEAISSTALDDRGLDDAPDGLSIWEGSLWCSSSDYFSGEVECELQGAFRELTDHEWYLLRTSGIPWEFEEESEKGSAT